MNTNDIARMDYLSESLFFADDAKRCAAWESQRYAQEFDAAYERRQIINASLRAQWHNIILPAIKAGRYFGAVPEAR